MAEKNVGKKYRIRKGRVALAAVIVFALLAGIVIGIVSLVHNISGRKNTQAEPAGILQTLPEGEYVRIDMEDCNMYVGTIMRLKCVSEPGNYADKVMWKSSDDGVVSVNKTGDILVRSAGTAAITATYGTLSDSVIIKAVNRDSHDTDSNLPVYDVDDKGQIVVAETAAGNEGTGNILATDAYPAVTSGITSSDDGKDMTEAAHPSDAAVQTVPAADGENPESGGNEPKETETSEDSQISYQEMVTQTAVNSGFKQYVGDTYIFAEDDNYLGEAIIGPDYVQIYVMTRTSSFDSAVKNVITSVVPDSCESIFTGFVSADRDQTINADGHMVRIIAPSGGGHAQLIIYY